MSYAIIDITEVGPAEYPLISVLQESIFSEFGHRFSVPFAEQIAGQSDVLALIAHLEGNPVAYKVGYRERSGRFYSASGGVLKDYRGGGLGRRMQDWQHGALRARGYRWVWFNSFNKFRGMMQMGLSSGFVPVGVETRAEGELSVRFLKDLSLPDTAVGLETGELPALLDPQAGESHQVATGDQPERLEVLHDRVGLVRLALNVGFDITGMRFDAGRKRGRLLMERATDRPA